MIRTNSLGTLDIMSPSPQYKICLQTPNSAPGGSDSEGLCRLGILTPGASYLPTRRWNAARYQTCAPLATAMWAAPEFSIALPFPTLCHSRVSAHLCWMNAWGDGTHKRTSLLLSTALVVVCWLTSSATSQCWLLQPTWNLLLLANGLLLWPIQLGLVPIF